MVRNGAFLVSLQNFAKRLMYLPCPSVRLSVCVRSSVSPRIDRAMQLFYVNLSDPGSVEFEDERNRAIFAHAPQDIQSSRFRTIASFLGHLEQ